MITQIRRPFGDDPDPEEPIRGADTALAAAPLLEEGRSLDPYAAAELLRRTERTELMIKKAHEQFH